MTDDRSSSGFGSSKNDEGTAVLERLIQVRMSSGKIYGPYRRDEVIDFIRKSKVQGDEDILVEGEMAWRAISSDVEFFDELQNVLLGVSDKPKKKKRSKEEEKRTQTVPLGRDEKTVRIEDRQGSEGIFHKPLNELKVPRQLANVPLMQSENPPAPPTPPIAAFPEYESAPKKAFKKPKPLFMALLAVMAVVVVFAFVMNGSGRAKFIGTHADFSNIRSNKFYARHLIREVSRIPRFPELPKENLSASVNLGLPQGWGVQVWANDIELLINEKDPTQKTTSSYWVRWVWNLLWTATVVRSVDDQLAKSMATRAEDILDVLKNQKIINSETISLLEAVYLFDAAKWKDLESTLASNSLPEAKWLRAEAAWLDSWRNGSGAASKTESQTASLGGEQWWLTSQIRTNFYQSPSLLFQSLEQMAELDPLSYHLWFSAAQYYWKVSSGGVERSMRYFLIGFSSLSLYPLPVQEVVWDQFYKYLSAHGRKALVEKAFQNMEIVHTGENFLNEASKNWWDLGEEGLDVKTAVDQIYQKVKTSRAELVDLAALSVLGPVSNEGGSYMLEVAYRAAFDKNWDRASNMFTQVLKKEPKNILALGGKIWTDSSLYLFDSALNDLAKFPQVKAENGEYDRYQALIYSVAREYDEAEKIWNEHMRSYPTDAWTYFFYAQMKEGLDKNYDCTKLAGLARLHAEGELKARADLLYYRCGMRAGIGVKEALADLEKLDLASPNDLSIQLERVEAHIITKNLAEALQLARAYVEKNPRSYDLRLKLGDVYKIRGDFDRAVAFYNNAVELRPRSAEAFVKIAKVLDDLKRYPEAAQNLETAATVQPSYPDIYLMAARAYVKLKNVGKAAEMFIREVQARPSSAGTFIEASEFFLSINAPQEVPKLYKLFSEDFQQDPKVLTRLAQAYLGMGQFETARLNAANALVHDKKIPEPHRILGEAFEGLGNYQAARDHYTNYLLLMPAAPEAAQIRAKILQPPFSQ